MPKLKPKLLARYLSSKCHQVNDSTIAATQAQENGGASTNGGMIGDPDNAIGTSLEVHIAYKKTFCSVEEVKKPPPRRKALLKLQVPKKQVSTWKS